ncbi:hypothetical protein FEA24_00365 [Mannheimia haemolytica]|nr:hypothetical protein B824_25270 [Mannheimia haemolytica USDA-ARS-USMARC-184]TRC23475.1 hypothetical protein FEA24_00365 [Mannheimia haemolytica]TRC26101.1 hypothetical protein FEA55_00310 [Mannheimia haemolytica]
MEPSFPFKVTPAVPSAPLTPTLPSTPSLPSLPGPPMVKLLFKAKSIALLLTVVMMFLSLEV